MSETTDTPVDAASTGSTGSADGSARGGLGTKLMPELRAIATGLGIKATGLKKAALVEAIRGAQSGAQSGDRSGGRSGHPTSSDESGTSRSDGPAAQPDATATGDEQGEARSGRGRSRRRGQQDAPIPTDDDGASSATTPSAQADDSRGESARDDRAATGSGDHGSSQPDRDRPDQQRSDESQTGRNRSGRGQSEKNQPEKNQSDKTQTDKTQTDRSGVDTTQQGGQHNGSQHNGAQHNGAQQGGDQSGDDEGGGRRNRRRRGRDRERPQGGTGAGPSGGGTNGTNGNGGGNNNGGNASSSGSGGSGGGGGGGSQGGRARNEPDTQILEDDVLTPCAGILDVLDNYAFVRTSGYLPGAEDVYVSLSMVRKLGLRRGDAITGQVRQPREGERKEKFNPLVTIDSVNGGEPEAARTRVEFDQLTPLHPSERLRLETDGDNLTGRVIDVVAPLGKGQRALVVSPPQAGRTMVLQSIARAVTRNNPECHLMVVLVDERPEEVTDFQRAVHGEVISSTFDRPAGDHTTLAELAIERAKRLVELGHDVVLLLDGITRLARAYNVSGSSSGRVLAGGVDSAALSGPKRFFGAARNVEGGGSLTIVATAVVETGSRTDEVILEEFQGTASSELRLRRDLADRRIFPAVDAVRSGTRRDDLLLGPEELAIVATLRRTLADLDARPALEQLLDRVRATRTNTQLLTAVQRSAGAASGS